MSVVNLASKAVPDDGLRVPLATFDRKLAQAAPRRLATPGGP